MGRSTSFDENGLKKGPWTPEEDKKLVQFIQKHGHGSWRSLPKLAGLNRCGKSCRLRWTNYLRPDIKRGKFSKEEEQTILNLHSILGNKWSAIATHLPGRTDNEIKNFWNTHLKKKLIQMGFDPKTHCPRSDFFTSLPQLIALANLRDVMDYHPWEEHAARLQEAVQVANFQYMQRLLQSAAAMNSSPNGLNGIADMNAINLLNSFLAPKDPILSNPCQIDSSSQSSIGGAPLQPSNGEVLLNCHSDLQLPCNFRPPMNSGTDLSHEEETPKSASPPFVSENSISNGSDGICGTSNYDRSASPFWNELFLDDPFLHEIAFS